MNRHSANISATFAGIQTVEVCQRATFQSSSGSWLEATLRRKQTGIQGTFDIDRPCSWTHIDHPTAQTNMGTGVYSLDIELPALQADDWILDLGDVRESARVRINGQEAGCAWAVPYQLKVGQFLKPGKNHIEIEVTNLPANRIAELDRQGVQWQQIQRNQYC